MRYGKAERIRVRNVPSFTDKLGVRLVVQGVGTIIVDTAYGGDSFVIVDAASLGLSLSPDQARDMATSSATREATRERHHGQRYT